MLILTIGFPSCLRRRATHRKSPWGTPDHIHRHGGIEIHGMGTPHRDYTGFGIFITGSIRHRVGQSISSCIIYIHGSSES